MKQPYQCPLCPRIIHGAVALRSHMAKHAGGHWSAGNTHRRSFIAHQWLTRKRMLIATLPNGRRFKCKRERRWQRKWVALRQSI